MADFHDLADFFGGGGINDKEWLLGVFAEMRRPFGAGVRDNIILGGIDVILPNNGDEIRPGSFEVCRRNVVFRWLRRREREGRGRRYRGRVLGAQVVA